VVVILGGGIAGLAASHKLREHNMLNVVYEARSNFGGLLDNFEVSGFRFDQAIHLSFADDEKSRAIFDQTPYLTHKPESLCFEEGAWLRHPIQNNLYPLPVDEKVELIEGFVTRPDISVDNYEDWLRFQYGHTFAERYPLKYTKKYWGVDAKELGLDWIGSRMHTATLKQVLEGAFTDKVPNYYYAKEMRYPKVGGYKRFLDPLLPGLNINLSKRCVAVDLHERSVSFESGETIKFDRLISTIPLPQLISCISDVPNHVREASEKLQWTKVFIVSIGLNKSASLKEIWTYIYDEAILASRVYAPNLKSPDNCPDGCSSLQFEIYLSNKATQVPTAEKCLENSICAMEKMQIASRSEIAVTDVRLLEYGNVTFYKNMEDDRKLITDWLVQSNVELAGRFGCWDYLWSHQAMLSGFSAAERLLMEAGS
jgi:protoporphyrinogen oxidase